MKTLESVNNSSGNENALPFISIVIPLEKTLPARKQNEIRIKKIIRQAKTQLTEKYDKNELSDLLHAIDQLHERIDLNQHVEGVGLLVSSLSSELLYFPFPVEEKVLIDDTFEIRDLILDASQNIQYWVLTLSNKHTRLFRGKGKNLEEIQDEQFPLKYEEQFEYAGRQKPKMVGSVVYGTEESQLKKERQREYFRHVEKRLTPYLKKESLPLFLMGVAWYQPIFRQVTHHVDAIADFIKGNYDHLSSEALVNKVWPTIEAYEQKERERVLNEIEEKSGQKRGYILGLQAIWQAAHQGKGAMLIVEKDYVQSAFYDAVTETISMEEREGLKKIEDGVDEIIKAVLSHQGKVVFLEQEQLEKYQHMDMFTRF
ncbi:baeRF3 domain-containing protein [Catalinimonas niigatensis]|uniref:baeRF3 domain-containing protein n=1 Tax=Catalinimonas niigatensis TaxID=1397264 RepID=UPI002665DA14|nr:hypothetical protein [Catalinimonas niigatensis]WPP49827.1 hypothetical protein PZB72_24450 [Catalinimonas niigatensis]